MQRIFSGEFTGDGLITIYGADAHHLARVLRMKPGEEIAVSDPSGLDRICRITYVSGECVTAEVISTEYNKAEPKYKATLYQGMPKGDKTDVIVQKAVELGASRIVPFESSRCIKRPKADKIEEKTRRLSKIAAEAAKQCGRARLPEVTKPLTFAQMLEEASCAEIALFCYEGEGTVSLKSALDKDGAKRICAVVGCEGGFSEREARELVEVGFIPVNLGPRILRCETAPSYVLSAISYKFEL